MSKQRFMLFLCWIFTACMYPQKDSTAVKYDTCQLEIQEITFEDLKIYHDDPKFNYEIIKEELTWWDDIKTWFWNLLLQFFEWLFGVEKAVGFLSVFFQWIPYILLGILIFILIRFLLNVNSRSLLHAKKNRAFVALSEDEHIIRNEDIQQLMQQALKDKNYRLAIRYYYLHILKLMSEKELIDWELQKTNDDYLREIKNQELRSPFRAITRLYDYIWYGGFNIDEAKYLKAETVFTSLHKSLDSYG